MRKTYSLEYVQERIPENITGFDDISELMDYFETEKVDEIEIVEAEVNIA